MTWTTPYLMTSGGSVPSHTLASISPTSASRYDDNTKLTITGTGFVQGASVEIDGVAQITQYVSATTLYAWVKSGWVSGSPFRTAGSKGVRVRQGGRLTLASATLTVNAWDKNTDIASEYMRCLPADITESGGNVTGWTDSGHGRSYTTLTGTPTYNASNNPLGGPSLNLGGASKLRTGAFTLAQPLTYFLVCRLTTPQNSTNVRVFDGGTQNEVIVNMPSDGELAQFSISAVVHHNKGLKPAVWGAFTSGHNGASSVLKIVGTEETSGSNPGTQGLTNGVALGGAAASLFAKLDACEMRLYSANLSLGDRNRLLNQTAVDYGFSIQRTHSVQCHGDSLTAGTGASQGGPPNVSWPSRLDTNLLATDRPKYGTIKNYAVSGYTIAQVRANLQTMIDTDVDYIRIGHFWVATNSILANMSGADAYAAYIELLQYANYVGIRPIAHTIIDRGWTTQQRIEANTFNSLLIANYAPAYYLINTTADSKFGPENARLQTTWWNTDQIHLNGTGYSVYETDYARPATIAVAAM